MVDILRMIKNVMDAHGAWVFGGAVAAGLVAHQARKRRSFDADWFAVTCYGCGRSGFSDEMTHVTAPDGRRAYSCVRCQRPDLFRQAEGVDYSTIVYRVRITDLDNGYDAGENHHYRTMDRAMEHVNKVIEAYDWYGFKEIPAAGERRKWKTTSGEDWEILMTPIRLGNIVREAEATNACPHCEGAAGFPREFYYQSDRIDMVPCGTCLTQGRCPGCMEIYPGLTRDNTPEDVFFGPGCTRCGYSEADARAARKTARRWADLVDNPAAAKFMAEYDDLSDSPEDHPELHTKDYIECEVCSNSLSFAEVMSALGWTFDGYCDQCVEERMDAEDYGVGAVWMADTYDVSKHGSLLPTGSVKRFLSSMPTQQNFNVTFVKSNGEVREMDAILTKPYDPDNLTCDVLEITGRGSVFKRFRVDRVIALYRV